MSNGLNTKIESRKDRIIVPKGWGEEEWIINNDKYCGKILRFNYDKKCSLHYHKIKDEIFLCTKGIFLIEIGENENKLNTLYLFPNESLHIPVGILHRMTGLLEHKNELIEFSSTHYDDDSYRVIKGD